MVVAGDHANNDMADPDDEESWLSQFTADEAFESVECQIAGLGGIEDIQKIYVEHTAAASDFVVANAEGAFPVEDGEYTVRFTTDSGMFHINETLDNKATLTVKDGQGTVHITLAGTGIVNLYVGLAADAEADEANWLQPTEDEVTYDDGTTETVYGFDVPVSVVDEEFDLALLGTKGTWYDHKVKVEMPQ